MVETNGMATLPLNSLRSPNQIDHRGAAEVSEQEAYASAVSVANSKTCSPLEKDASLSNTRPRKCKESPQLKCDFPDCTHEGTFPRTWELRRHMESKHHVGAKRFVCCAERCLNKQSQSPWAFTRSDKLTAHVKATHNRDTIFAACPIDGCNLGHCTLETLGVHIARAHKDCEAGRAILNASSCKVRKCPLWRCGKHVKTRDLQGHVAGHPKHDVLAATLELNHEGLVVKHAAVSSQQDSAHLGLVINVPCPICNTTSDDMDHFVTHFWANHLFLAGSGGADHFKAWKSVLIRHTPNSDLLPWANLRYWVLSRRGLETIACPSCLLTFGDSGRSRYRMTNSQRAAMDAIFTHHLSLLRPEAEVIAEVFPHRVQILRLYPEFVSHSVFADFDQPQDIPSIP